MNSTKLGKEAEQKVAQLLRSNKHRIDSVNWRTRWCEIDIVSIKDGVVYFTEVKFRSKKDWGSGLDYITTRKLKQMKFAAEIWIGKRKWQGEAQLQAAEIDAEGRIVCYEITA